MRISESFTSIQGEGPTQGQLATFVRFSGCNLRCGFCDTAYAQSVTEGHSLEGITEMRDMMVAAREKYGPNHLFIFTGGEPLMQQEEAFVLLGAYFSRSAKRANVWFETNGTFAPAKPLVVRFTPQFVVSPKKGHLKLEALQALADLEAHFKFVIDPKGKDSFSVEEAADLVQSLKVVPRFRVWLQPMAKDKTALGAAGRWLWQRCIETGYNFSPRLHVALHGNKRGV